MANNMILVNGYNFHGENMSNFSETISSESSVTYVSENPPIQIKIVGLINTICFQRAKRYALVMARHLPAGYAPPEIIPYFEVEWNEYLLRHKRLYGGHYYKVKKPLIVYKDNEYLGDDEDLINYLQQFYQISVLEDFEAEAVQHMKQYIEKNDRTYISMLISINDVCFGTLVFCLYNDICPNTCANFLRLSTLKRRGYAGAPVHRICRNSWVQFGGWKLKRSSEPLACENYAVPHDKRGVLSMCHNGKHRDNSTQFFVSLNPTPWMNYLYCAFGQLVIGDEILTKISNVETCDECPLSNITICQSGLYSFYQVITPENEKLLKTLYKAKIRGSSGSMTPPDKVDSATKTDLDRALKTPPERRDPRLKKDLDDELKQIVDPVYRLPQTPYRLEDELLFRPYNEVLLGSKAKVLKHKIKGSDKVVTAEGVVRPIVKTLLKKVVPKKVISKAPQSVLDSRDVPSNFSISKFNNGMYDFIETLL